MFICKKASNNTLLYLRICVLSIRIIFDDKRELNELLVFSNYVEVPAKAIPDPKGAENYFVWASKSDKKLLGIKKELFDERGRLQNISTSDWNDDMLIVD